MTRASLSRRLDVLEVSNFGARFVDISGEDLTAGRIPRGWSLYKAIRASYGYDPDSDEPVGPRRPTVWQGPEA
jgi:hypothetical protein